MQIESVHFYVKDAIHWRNWFVNVLRFQSQASSCTRDTHTETVVSHPITIHLSSPITSNSPVAEYLALYAEGVADLAFRIEHLEATIDRAIATGTNVLQPIHQPQATAQPIRKAQIQGWGTLRHTLIESVNHELVKPPIIEHHSGFFSGIDHVVLNVAKGELDAAIEFYTKIFGLQPQQRFNIQTQRSALCSRVLIHPTGTVQLPINQPASPNSQIQEFLDLNGGSGIQHIALRTNKILATVQYMRHTGTSFIHVPDTYYAGLRDRGVSLDESIIAAIHQQEILMDWKLGTPEAFLLQTFTQPIFSQPTFFFELIQRNIYGTYECPQVAQGFGERNFQALFEAIEREQLKRGNLEVC